MKKKILRALSVFLTACLVLGFSIAAYAKDGAYSVDVYSETGPSQLGKVFAGWYTDETCKTPYTEKTGEAYAKFVPAEVLKVKAQLASGTSSSSAKTDIKLITTVDSLSFKDVGFELTVKGKTTEIKSKTVFKKIVAEENGVSKEYEPSSFNSSSAYFMTLVVTDIPQNLFAEKLKIVPFWTTLDGTRVTGDAKLFSVEDGLKGESFPEESDYIKYMKRTYPDYVESPVGLDITFKEDIVAICYPVWHDYIRAYNYGKIYDISKILKGEGTWGPMHHFHYWQEPALGYYLSSDKNVIRTHMTQLSEAGVDIVIIDNSNVECDWQNYDPHGNRYVHFEETAWYLSIDLPITAVLDTCLEMRAEGLKTPHLVFWNRNAGRTEDALGWSLNNKIYHMFVRQEKYKDLWVYMRNEYYGTAKPFMMGTGVGPDPSGITVEDEYPGTNRNVRYMTYRSMWGLQEGITNRWSFLSLENNPRRPVVDDVTGQTYYEQISVSPAVQADYMTSPTARGRQGGLFFYGQWKNAFKYHPKMIVLAVWAELEAQSFPDINGDGQPEFVDQYTLEYSRDLEPMKDYPYDMYYQWLKQYIAAYKTHKPCPRLVEKGR